MENTIGGQDIDYSGYAYDTDGRLVNQGTPAGYWTYGYDAKGFLHTASRTDGLSIEYGYDAAGRATSLTWNGVAHPLAKSNNDYRTTSRFNLPNVTVSGNVRATAPVPVVTISVNGSTPPQTLSVTAGKFSRKGCGRAVPPSSTRRMLI